MQPILVPSLAALLLFASSGAPRPRGSSPDKPVDLVLTHGQTLRGTIHARSIRIPSSARVIVTSDVVLKADTWLRIEGTLAVANASGELPKDAADVELQAGVGIEVSGQVLGGRGSDSPTWGEGPAGSGSDIVVRAPVTWVDGVVLAGSGGAGWRAARGGAGGTVQVFGACLTRSSDPDFELRGGPGGRGGAGTPEHVDAGAGGRGGDAYVHDAVELVAHAETAKPQSLPFAMALPQSNCSPGAPGAPGTPSESVDMAQGIQGTANGAVGGVGGEGGRGNPSADAVGGAGGGGGAGADCCSPPGTGGAGGQGGAGGTGHSGRGGRGGRGGDGGPCASHTPGSMPYSGGGITSLPCDECVGPGRGGKGGRGGNSGNGAGGAGGPGGPGGRGQNPGSGGTGGPGGNGGTDGPGGSGPGGGASCTSGVFVLVMCCHSWEHTGEQGSMGDFGPFPPGPAGGPGANGAACPSPP